VLVLNLAGAALGIGAVQRARTAITHDLLQPPALCKRLCVREIDPLTCMAKAKRRPMVPLLCVEDTPDMPKSLNTALQ
jgi:hypothetical protein